MTTSIFVDRAGSDVGYEACVRWLEDYHVVGLEVNGECANRINSLAASLNYTHHVVSLSEPDSMEELLKTYQPSFFITTLDFLGSSEDLQRAYSLVDMAVDDCKETMFAIAVPCTTHAQDQERLSIHEQQLLAYASQRQVKLDIVNFSDRLNSLSNVIDMLEKCAQVEVHGNILEVV